MSAELTEGILARARRDWDPSGEMTIQDAVCCWANCRHAEVDDTGGVWVEGPMVGHHLNAERLAALVSWMRAEGMIDDEGGAA